MVQEVASKSIDSILTRFRKTGDVSLLLDTSFFDPTRRRFHKRQKLENNWDSFSCYQFALAHLLERYYPLVVAFMEQENPGRIGSEPDYFLDIMGQFEIALREEHHVQYKDMVVGERGEVCKYDTWAEADRYLNDDFLPLILSIEQTLQSGFLYVTNGTHGELYIARFVEKRVNTLQDDMDKNGMRKEENRAQQEIFVHKISREHDCYSDCWRFGNYLQWSSETSTQLGFGTLANFNILHTDLCLCEDDILFPPSKLSTRTEFDRMLRTIDLREVVSSVKMKYGVHVH
jgi:hypothetical protein